MQILPASMTSLPTPACWPETLLQAPATPPSTRTIGTIARDDEQFLLRAFRSFSEAAGSLECSYQALSTEVERLRRELAASNTDLARSLEQNRCMREHLDCILQGLPCGVLVVTADGCISRANPEASRLLGNSGAVPSKN